MKKSSALYLNFANLKSSSCFEDDHLKFTVIYSVIRRNIGDEYIGCSNIKLM